MDKLLERHAFTINPQDNGGEQLIIITEVYDNGNNKNNVYLNQEIQLCSYCNSASFNLITAALTPEKLRQLANELDSMISKHTKV